MNINTNNCPNLFNLLSLTNVIPSDTMIEDTDTGALINLNRLIEAAAAELQGLGE